ncbi:HNH endonuclease signature motif containing protein [Elizabethkingia anophelis]|uniref:HNH endonuclease signature motif containing protein n=1 Tax=Elizabethkingia anophelis TaxID=1117645 RepID=UPI00162373EF|nr:HNH endonuclease signature motif containing protein [Elizabethkingia anophelis]GJN60441.1 hypothetical protein ELAK_05910 [Elizabethkingia anophelis]HDP3254031.1 HNH endonuclease [Elizabethkingia anophelis]
METRRVFINNSLGHEIRTDYAISSNGEVKRDGKIIKPCIGSRGYYLISICVDGRQYPRSIHRLVANAFIPNPENKPQVNHKNGNKADNSIENLEWVTSSENIIHAFGTGLKKAVKGSEHYISKLTEDNVINIRERAKSKYRGLVKELAIEYNVDQSLISRIISGEYWKHI